MELNSEEYNLGKRPLNPIHKYFISKLLENNIEIEIPTVEENRFDGNVFVKP